MVDSGQCIIKVIRRLQRDSDNAGYQLLRMMIVRFCVISSCKRSPEVGSSAYLIIVEKSFFETEKVE